MKSSPTSHHIGILVLTLTVLILLSLVPWSRLTDNTLKNFNLFEDLCISENNDIATLTENDIVIDPELKALETESTTSTDNDTTKVCATLSNESTNTASIDRTYPVIVDNCVLIEDYADRERGLSALKTLLQSSAERLVRIGVIGDSFIEGDIFCQDVREKLQERFGGYGVGYMPLHTDFPGFRNSIVQTCSGWTAKDMRNIGTHDSIKPIAGEYFLAESTTKTTYKGAKKAVRSKSWDNSRFVFIAPNGGTISLETDSCPTQTFNVEASARLQILTIPGHTSKFTIKTNATELKAIGAYLDSNSGVAVDCMSLRGNAGLAHRKLDVNLSQKLSSAGIDYDMIIVEYGINALTAEQKDYTTYATAMAQTINHIKQCYPNTLILMMGIADRGYKSGTVVKSLPTCQAMTTAQRNVAQKTSIMFWDMRAAMGGENSIVDWRKRKLMNVDYIHINHKGGEELALLFVESLLKSIDME